MTHRWVDPLCPSTCLEESLDQLVNDLNCTTFRIAETSLNDMTLGLDVRKWVAGRGHRISFSTCTLPAFSGDHRTRCSGRIFAGSLGRA